MMQFQSELSQAAYKTVNRQNGMFSPALGLNEGQKSRDPN